MQVQINEIVSNVRAVDGDALLTAPTLRRIVDAVLQAVDARDAHRSRVRAETRVTGGVAHEQAEEGR